MTGGIRAGCFALLAVGVLALTGCFSSSSSKMGDIRTTAPPSPVGLAALAADENPNAARDGALPAPARALDPAKSNATTFVQVAALPAVQPPAPVPSAEGLKRLVGLDRASLETMLGPPWLLRREAAAELWQYRAPNCVLDLFLYPKSEGELRVAHADLRSRRENRPVPAGCFAELVGRAGQRAEAVKG